MLTRFIPYIKFAPYALGVIFALIALVQYGNARHWEKRYIASEKVVAQYEAAQVAAIEINKAKVAEIERQYAKIAEKSEVKYEERIADNRTALDRWMRNQASKGHTNSTGASQVAPVSGEVVSGTETAIVFATVPISDLEIVADAYAQLEALQSWAKGVGSVEP